MEIPFELSPNGCIDRIPDDWKYKFWVEDVSYRSQLKESAPYFERRLTDPSRLLLCHQSGYAVIFLFCLLCASLSVCLSLSVSLPHLSRYHTSRLSTQQTIICV